MTLLLATIPVLLFYAVTATLLIMSMDSGDDPYEHFTRLGLIYVTPMALVYVALYTLSDHVKRLFIKK